MNNRASAINQKVGMAVGTVDSLNLISIFILLLTDITRQMFQETARFILLPVSGALAATNAILAIRQAKLDGGKNGTLTNAIIETLSALAVMTAIIGGFVAASIFATVSPIILTCITSAKALFHLVATGYYLVHAVLAEDDKLKANYFAAVRAHAVATTALVLASVAVSLVMIAAKPIMGILGIIAGAIAISYSIYKLVTSPPLPNNDTPQKTEQEKPSEQLDQEPGLSNSAKLQKVLTAEKSDVEVQLHAEQPVITSLWQKSPQLITENLEHAALKFKQS